MITASLAACRKLGQLLAFELLDVGDLEELAAPVLGPDGLELVVPVHLVDVGGHPGDDGHHLLGGVAAVVLQGGAPHRVQGRGLLQDQERQAESCRREQRARDIDQAEVQETDLQRVLGERVLEHINLPGLGVPPEITYIKYNCDEQLESISMYVACNSNIVFITLSDHTARYYSTLG